MTDERKWCPGAISKELRLLDCALPAADPAGVHVNEVGLLVVTHAARFQLEGNIAQ